MRLPQALGFLLGPGALALTAIAGLAPSTRPSGLRFSVTYKTDKSQEPLDGRLLLMLSKDKTAEPRTRSATRSEDPADLRRRRRRLEGRQRRSSSRATCSGYPVESLAAIPPGTYQVQALLHRYETFRRADGHVVKLPMDRGEGQQWNKAPGNLYSTPREITIEPGKPRRVRDRARQGHPADPRPAHDEVHQARADPERAALEVLGPADVPRRAHPAARRASTRIPTRATRSSSSTATSPTRSTASARSRRIRT